ncbi:hypothetical protein OUZ56_027831 [Daphnia magna]|uniref:Uncharacterized protein n=1 Tax=Daphnia magna TaxID=35525 RepID=A0ABR0B2P4_9CRUS|nr:hypothetical protein OUZ56_027831 [Daphnia magna]
MPSPHCAISFWYKNFYPRAANCSSSFPTKNRRSNTNHPVMRRYRIYHVTSTLTDTWQRGRFLD